mmetsp:Transcript_5528/g.9426  ORF Transcript_5528/g.9426 Transcript_5528/m.9426 type:complete len:100 (-) Transcript_5528:1076-1375(-)
MDQKSVSPLLRPFNYLIIGLSLCLLLSNGSQVTRNMLIFEPNQIIDVTKASSSKQVRLQKEGGLSIPALWTMVSSMMVEDSLISLAVNLVLMNYIMNQN